MTATIAIDNLAFTDSVSRLTFPRRLQTDNLALSESVVVGGIFQIMASLSVTGSHSVTAQVPWPVTSTVTALVQTNLTGAANNGRLAKLYQITPAATQQYITTLTGSPNMTLNFSNSSLMNSFGEAVNFTNVMTLLVHNNDPTTTLTVGGGSSAFMNAVTVSANGTYVLTSAKSITTNNLLALSSPTAIDCDLALLGTNVPAVTTISTLCCAAIPDPITATITSAPTNCSALVGKTFLMHYSAGGGGSWSGGYGNVLSFGVPNGQFHINLVLTQCPGAPIAGLQMGGTFNYDIPGLPPVAMVEISTARVCSPFSIVYTVTGPNNLAECSGFSATSTYVFTLTA